MAFFLLVSWVVLIAVSYRVAVMVLNRTGLMSRPSQD
jgi:hypothetical protein